MNKILFDGWKIQLHDYAEAVRNHLESLDESIIAVSMDRLFVQIVRDSFRFQLLVNCFSSVFEFNSSFFVKDWLVKLNSTPNKLDEVDRLRLNNLLNVTSTMIIDDGTHEEYLRICKHCGKVLQQFYDQNRFRNIQKDQAILQYDVDQVFYLF